MQYSIKQIYFMITYPDQVKPNQFTKQKPRRQQSDIE